MSNQLSGQFTFWFQKFQKTETSDFKNTLHTIANLSSPREFWNYYQHLKRPSNLDDGSYIYLFRKGIKPIWEDKANVGGGSFVILAEKAKANKMWEDVLLSFITAQDIAAPINGLRLKIKKEVAHIDVWVSNLQQDKTKEAELKKWVLESAGLKKDTNIEFLHFNTES